MIWTLPNFQNLKKKVEKGEKSLIEESEMKRKEQEVNGQGKGKRVGKKKKM